MLSVLAPLSILNYSTEVAEIAGKVVRDLNRPFGFADAAIAATCIFNDAELATINVKDFEKIPYLNLYKN